MSCLVDQTAVRFAQLYVESHDPNPLLPKPSQINGEMSTIFRCSMQARNEEIEVGPISHSKWEAIALETTPLSTIQKIAKIVRLIFHILTLTLTFKPHAAIAKGAEWEILGHQDILRLHSVLDVRPVMGGSDEDNSLELFQQRYAKKFTAWHQRYCPGNQEVLHGQIKLAQSLHHTFNAQGKEAALTKANRAPPPQLSHISSQARKEREVLYEEYLLALLQFCARNQCTIFTSMYHETDSLADDLIEYLELVKVYNDSGSLETVKQALLKRADPTYGGHFIGTLIGLRGAESELGLTPIASPTISDRDPAIALTNLKLAYANIKLITQRDNNTRGELDLVIDSFIIENEPLRAEYVFQLKLFNAWSAKLGELKPDHPLLKLKERFHSSETKKQNAQIELIKQITALAGSPIPKMTSSETTEQYQTRLEDWRELASSADITVPQILPPLLKEYQQACDQANRLYQEYTNELQKIAT